MSGEQEPRHDFRTLVDDVQRFAFLSAAAVVSRYVQLVDGVLTGGELPWPGEPDGLRAAILDGLRERPAPNSVETLVLPTTRAGSSSEGPLWIHNPTSSPVSGIHLEVTPLTCSGAAVIPLDAISISPSRTPAVEAHGRQQVWIRVAVPVGQAVGVYHGLVIGSLAPSEPVAVRLEVATRPRSR
ncbi:MAG TPA: hypothetical protein VJN29_00960 [Intrasporangium sp.]|uniref:hypothetical protein n=1 Tax=Intrasporangium sp. TaxID=1925024 RepID=UPI002B470AF4|nr:hypothetical protein [Intrasporangium sp.]HKX65768.1 hypothetical protein [Intrasporangium sp.]